MSLFVTKHYLLHVRTVRQVFAVATSGPFIRDNSSAIKAIRKDDNPSCGYYAGERGYCTNRSNSDRPAAVTDRDERRGKGGEFRKAFNCTRAGKRMVLINSPGRDDDLRPCTKIP